MTRFFLVAMALYSSAISASTLTRECEHELALSALPAHLRDQATVYVWADDEFEVSRKGATFSCIVARNHPMSIIPQCVDPLGRESILPALIWKSESIMSGMDPAQLGGAFRQKLENGDFVAPTQAGVSYMSSAFNRIHIGAQNQRISVGPHVMFYAPGVSNDQIGGSMEHARSNRGLPFVIDEGPHGYMVSFVDRATDTQDVQTACKGQLEAFGIES